LHAQYDNGFHQFSLSGGIFHLIFVVYAITHNLFKRNFKPKLLKGDALILFEQRAEKSLDAERLVMVCGYFPGFKTELMVDT